MAQFFWTGEPPLMRVEEYDGRADLEITPTQLASNGLVTAAEQRRILRDWIAFLADAPLPIRRLSFFSRVPQELLDAVAGQRQLEHLSVKWGPYSDLSALRRLTGLQSLWLQGATSVTDLAPLTSLASIDTLVVDQPFRVADPGPIGELTTLRDLSYAAAHLGTNRVLRIDSLEWVRSLRELEILGLAGTRIPAEALATLLELPRLVSLSIPLRRHYRATVVEDAQRSAAFAEVARKYDSSDEIRRRHGLS